MNPIFLSDLKFLEERKVRSEQGYYNCLEFPFEKASNYFPGFERYGYIIITANQKVGKSKFVDFVFVYKSIEYILENKRIKPHILYFPLEETPKAKRLSFYEYLFYKIDGIIIDNKVIKSTKKGISAPQWVFDKLQSEEYQRYINAYFSMVEFPTDSNTGFSVSSVDDIYNAAIEYAKQHGHYNYVKKTVYNNTFKCMTEEDVIDENNPFTWDDDELMPMIILDNFANLKIPKGSTKYIEIENMSKKLNELRKMGFLVVGVQHQAQEKESLTRRQANDVVPSAEGLDGNKSTSKDITLLAGLMSPFKYEMADFMGYDIKRWKDNIRFLFIKEDRENGAINLCVPLLFIGESSVFAEMPEYTDKEGLDRVYNDLLMKRAEYDRLFYSNRGKFNLLTIVNKKEKSIFANSKLTNIKWLQ